MLTSHQFYSLKVNKIKTLDAVLDDKSIAIKICLSCVIELHYTLLKIY
jgi:hypothetical protein